MAVRRLGQSLSDLLRHRAAVSQAGISVGNAQQRNFANQPKQQDIDGIPVEVCLRCLAYCRASDELFDL